jgi:hypothetical protein
MDTEAIWSTPKSVTCAFASIQYRFYQLRPRLVQQRPGEHFALDSECDNMYAFGASEAEAKNAFEGRYPGRKCVVFQIHLD